jgi:hypothetical protein
MFIHKNAPHSVCAEDIESEVDTGPHLNLLSSLEHMHWHAVTRTAHPASLLVLQLRASCDLLRK